MSNTNSESGSSGDSESRGRSQPASEEPRVQGPGPRRSDATPPSSRGPNPHFQNRRNVRPFGDSNRRPGPIHRHRAGGSSRGPQSHLPEAANRRLSEIEAAGEPLSLSERISIEGDRARAADRLPYSVDDAVSIAKLHLLQTEDLRAAAVAEGVERTEDLNRQQLIYQIMKRRLKARGLIYGEGTLEILPDGFGFLRSAKNHYQSGPDDIYVSPSQIRKFGLRDGMMIAGQIRPPKENEGYFALLRVDAINYRDPKEGSQVKRFDELTPVHPDSRIHLEHDPHDMATRIIDMMCPLGF